MSLLCGLTILTPHFSSNSAKKNKSKGMFPLRDLYVHLFFCKTVNFSLKPYILPFQLTPLFCKSFFYTPLLIKNMFFFQIFGNTCSLTRILQKNVKRTLLFNITLIFFFYTHCSLARYNT